MENNKYKITKNLVLSVITIYLILNSCIVIAQKNYSELLKEFDKVGSCNYKIKFTYSHPDLSKDGLKKYIVYIYVKTPSLIHAKYKNQHDSTLMFLYKNLTTSNYDYVSNLFLYQFCGRQVTCGDSLQSCTLWSKYLKKRDLKYWEDYIKQNIYDSYNLK